MRIGILGGTFDPIHNGHLNLAREAKVKLSLDKIIFVPAYIPPQKNINKIADAEDRSNMVTLAVKGNKDFEISHYEIEKKGESYTIDTIRYFKNRYPKGTEFFFLIGADTLKEISSWKDIAWLLKNCRFVVCNRPGYSKDIRYKEIKGLDIVELDVSSTMIRERIKEDKDISRLVPNEINDYIKTKHLYK